jgi:hypothetical protein
MFRKSDRATIIAASILSPMCCHSVSCGTTGLMQPRMQSVTQKIIAVNAVVRVSFAAFDLLFDSPFFFSKSRRANPHYSVRYSESFSCP